MHFQEDLQLKENSDEINGEALYTNKHFEEKSGKKQNKKTEMAETERSSIQKCIPAETIQKNCNEENGEVLHTIEHFQEKSRQKQNKIKNIDGKNRESSIKNAFPGGFTTKTQNISRRSHKKKNSREKNS